MLRLGAKLLGAKDRSEGSNHNSPQRFPSGANSPAATAAAAAGNDPAGTSPSTIGVNGSGGDGGNSSSWRGNRSSRDLWPFPSPPPRQLVEAQVPSRLVQFTYRQLRDATKRFDSGHLIGEGGFGEVFHGKLRFEWSGDDMDAKASSSSSGRTWGDWTGRGQMRSVAVKRLKCCIGFNEHWQSEEFMREVYMLGQCSHPNIITLYGFSKERGEYLVYELVTGGNLEDALLESSRGELDFPWEARLKVALHVALGLQYMYKKRMIHRDIKASNILLQEDFTAKITDFGMVRPGPKGGSLYSHTGSRVMGTQGYIDPTYSKTGELGPKSDVYSYGIVLMELVTGQHVGDDNYELRRRVWEMTMAYDQSKDPRKYMDPHFGPNVDVEQVVQLAGLARACTSRHRYKRPAMREVLDIVKLILSKKVDRIDSQTSKENGNMAKTKLQKQRHSRQASESRDSSVSVSVSVGGGSLSGDGSREDDVDNNEDDKEDGNDYGGGIDAHTNDGVESDVSDDDNADNDDGENDSRNMNDVDDDEFVNNHGQNPSSR